MVFTLLNSLDILDGPVRRRIALYEGELTAIPPEHRADILVVSAFPNDYLPTQSSLIGALDRSGLSVGKLAAAKAHDLRLSSAFWISHAITGPAARMNIGQVACFEPRVRGEPPALVGDLFRGLFPFLDDRKDQTVAMPILTTGDQEWSKSLMFKSILDASVHWLARGLPIRELKIVERNHDAAVALSAAFDSFKSALPNQGVASQSHSSYDVFLSFSTQDAEAVDLAKAELLKKTGVKRVFDFRIAIDKGRSWQEEIDLAITSCRSIIAILSPSYFNSPECREELMQARLRNKRSRETVFFPVYWHDWGKELDLWLQTVNYSDCRECNRDLLVGAIRAMPLVMA